MIDHGVRMAASGRPADLIERELTDLYETSAAATEDWLDPEFVIGEEIITMIGNRWERGWQPADLLHYLSRKNPKVDDLGAAAAREQLRRSGLDQRLPPEWQQQLDGHPIRRPRPTGRADWLFGIDADPIRAWPRVLHLMLRLRQMHPLAPVGPPPSQWSRTPRSTLGAQVRTPRPHRDSDLLDRVRALLAKAESTTFSAEAEALTAKAQELTARHSIDEALVNAGGPGRRYDVSARRLHLDNPYAMTKALLVQEVAGANQVRAIWDEAAGASTVIGMEVDLEQVELLVTSLLVQATRAMTEAAHGTRSGSVNRSPTFRRSFLSAYATRIGERLSEASDRVAAEYGTELVPVLAERRAAVDEAVDELFPHVSRGGSRTVDLRGWQAGTAAADQAVLPRGRLSGGGD
ncbi:hypothetical protein GCM10011575_45190 [Microlunatus endophyticus]|uniref:DUF2786 domain-containing protein n=1 Tax=Microlunatus endophyticus TaxID=1716077 RepID=A0A917SIW8_9ACTN|nr:DUF2786 domain-containing protein [Microlunatus endophyticus]GGL81843.1 hypothetical protein GCM10011575_45190 [Microlunatus endophyticus]